ncbi:MAG: hypothetical protein K9N48_02915 [Verrucomicrobia bacterium]|nr:hypothetical protein [Verrucomicrobiota bacterium]MCF7708565.1 hypothetical protein [Verrucomicrobiota bacterium]
MAKPHFCNIFSKSESQQELWRFNIKGDTVTLLEDKTLAPGEQLPGNWNKTALNQFFQTKVNVAWCPSTHVCFRVVHLPTQDYAEAISMIEFQLEKLSPLPLTQIAWSAEPILVSDDGVSTVIVAIIDRQHVEEFAEECEQLGFMPDRMEIPFIHQLAAEEKLDEGARIYAGINGNPNSALVAWWSDGILQSLNWLNLPDSPNWPNALSEQLSQMAWAGELEGWLHTTPKYHLTATQDIIDRWSPVLHRLSWEETPTSPQLPDVALAGLSAQRLARNQSKINLLSAEYLTRYRQLRIDRIWMRAAGVAAALYLLIVLFYFGAVEIVKFQKNRIESQVKAIEPDFKKAVRLKTKLMILQDQAGLRYAALDCWKAAVTQLPPELTIESLSFQKGRFSLYGKAPSDQTIKVNEYNSALAKVKIEDTPLFSQVNPPNISTPRGNASATWNFACELKRLETE